MTELIPKRLQFIIFVNELYQVEGVAEREVRLRKYTRKKRGASDFYPTKEVEVVPLAFLIEDFPYQLVCEANGLFNNNPDGFVLPPKWTREVI